MFELDIDLSHYETTPAPCLVLKLSGSDPQSDDGNWVSADIFHNKITHHYLIRHQVPG